MVTKFIVSQAKLPHYRGRRFFFLLIHWGNPHETTNKNATNMQVVHSLVPRLLSLGMRLGHARQRPHLPILCMRVW